MRHTHIRVFVHIVFSTKNRRNTIREGFRQRLWSYIGGIARANKLHAIIIGGMGDHVHLLLAIPSTIAIGSRSDDQNGIQYLGGRTNTSSSNGKKASPHSALVNRIWKK